MHCTCSVRTYVISVHTVYGGHYTDDGTPHANSKSAEIDNNARVHVRVCMCTISSTCNPRVGNFYSRASQLLTTRADFSSYMCGTVPKAPFTLTLFRPGQARLFI